MKKRLAKITDNYNHSVCPFCGSDNILPFEDDSGSDNDLPVLIIILTALILIALYLALVVTSYMYFPVVVFIAIIFSTRLVNRHENIQKRKPHSGSRDFICLSCNSNYKESI